MKQAIFTAFCKFEIGDKVQIIESDVNELFEVYDIFTIHSLKNKTTDFVVRVVDEEGFYQDLNSNKLILVNCD